MTTGHATRLCASVALAFLSCTISSSVALGQEVIPHAQDAPPNPPKSPTEAIKAMKVPEGFTVELVASEPDIVNPVAMTIDEKGRFWITESLEYPRREPGPGRDRVKVLEDTNGDGKADKFTIFFDGLNIPSGIAVGYGGVWVANAPDILFIPDANRDAVADGPPEVVVSGFGRDDTHELPNSLTWGPDGWLYGWNGVFNPAKVKSNSGKTYEFTCAIWRIHPISREFQIFCEGTSNPWGIAINDDGEFFASACVIDHLWHLAQGAYYIRQGGPYPPFTYPAKSIVDHKHQKAAYCGIHWFDSDAYPEQYRNKLYMGNIHGNCINVDEIERKGSTYKASDCPDFLSANDAWFMPVVQQTGPDGSLYILDWYDRYHCYQDANRDPEGIDRLKGRLYRVRYKETPRAKIDLANEPSARLFDLLGAPNVFIRATARRLLIERGLMKHAPDRDPKPDSFYACPDLTNAAFNQEVSRTRRLESLWTIFALNGLLGTLPNSHTYKRALTDSDPVVRAWGLRGVSMLPNEVAVTLGRDIQAEIVGVLRDEKHPVVLRTLLGLGISEPDTSRLGLLGLSCLLRNSESDDLLTHLAWRAESLAADSAENTGELARFLNNLTPQQRERIAALWPRIIDRLVGNPTADGETLALVLKAGLDQANDDVSYRRPMLDSLTRAIRQGRFSGERLKSLQESLQDSVRRRLSDGSDPLQVDFVELAGAWGDPEALDALRKRLADNTSHPAARFEALEILVSRQDEGVVDAVAKLLTDHDAPGELRDNIFGTLGPLENARLADVVIDAYPALSPQSRQRALVLLSERASWGRTLLAAVEKDRVSKQDLNLNHLRKLLATKDPEVVRLIQLRWGSIRAGRNEQRDLVVGQMRNFLKKTTGNPAEGKRVYTKVCAQCHKIYGEGEEVGPDITLNGRNDFDQLISNVFDPNLVIGQGYQAVTVAATDGRILSGLLVENSPTRVVLKLQGGRVATLAREEVEELKTSEISLMPEDVEKQLTPQEIADLFAFLALDKPPDDPKAKRLPGAP